MIKNVVSYHLGFEIVRKYVVFCHLGLENVIKHSFLFNLIPKNVFYLSARNLVAEISLFFHSF